MGIFRTDTEALAAELAQRRAEGQCVVTTNGVFDIVHVGHVRYLQEARALGNLLVVGVNSDASVKRLKGPLRPFVGEAERAELLAALACVDYTVLFEEDTPEQLLDALRPSLHVKGGDYDTESLPETKIVRRHGGEVKVLAFTRGRSTTTLVEKIIQTAHPGERD